jgi:predicted GH43/DUF377 family glycosyl hydrolase
MHSTRFGKNSSKGFQTCFREWEKVGTLCCDNIMDAMLSDEVIAKIRFVLSKQTGYRITDEEFFIAIEEKVLKL